MAIMQKLLLALMASSVFLVVNAAENKMENVDTIKVPNSVVKFLGQAYDLNNNQLLYREFHSIELDAKGNRIQSTVEYRDADQNVIAFKTLRYDALGYLPSFKLTDTRSDYELKVDTFDEKRIGISQKWQAHKETQKVNKTQSRAMVVDAGFDVYLMKNWQKLIEGEAQVLDFLAPTRSQFIGFRLERRFMNEQTVGFSLTADNFFIGLLVDPILLEYDRYTGQILSYEGLTNLEDNATGDYYVARIEYSYEQSVSWIDNSLMIGGN